MTTRSLVTRILVSAVGLSLWLMTGCSSSINVNYDYDTTTNFGTYRTFDWAPNPVDATKTTDAAVATQNSGLLSNRIKSAVNLELAQKGLTQSSDNPDLLAVFHVGVQDKIQVTDWGYGYSNYYWGASRGMYGGGYGGMDVYQYQEGRMIIDLVDSQTHNLIWRGTGEGVVGQTQKSPEELQARINDVVRQIMVNYPPPLN